MNLRKTQKQRQVVSLDEVLSIDAEGNEMMLFDVLGDNTPSNLSKLLECEDVENLYKALNKLKKREKENRIKKIIQSGRSTFYCAHIQK